MQLLMRFILEEKQRNHFENFLSLLWLFNYEKDSEKLYDNFAPELLSRKVVLLGNIIFK
jgi:hypothetical protein